MQYAAGAHATFLDKQRGGGASIRSGRTRKIGYVTHVYYTTLTSIYLIFRFFSSTNLILSSTNGRVGCGHDISPASAAVFLVRAHVAQASRIHSGHRALLLFTTINPTGAALLPLSFFFFSAQFAARGVARCDRWLQARHATIMMKLSQVTNMDYTRIPLFSFSHFYFFPLRGASAIIFFFSDFLFFTFYYVLKFS